MAGFRSLRRKEPPVLAKPAPLGLRCGPRSLPLRSLARTMVDARTPGAAPTKLTRLSALGCIPLNGRHKTHTTYDPATTWQLRHDTFAARHRGSSAPWASSAGRRCPIDVDVAHDLLARTRAVRRSPPPSTHLQFVPVERAARHPPPQADYPARTRALGTATSSRNDGVGFRGGPSEADTKGRPSPPSLLPRVHAASPSPRPLPSGPAHRRPSVPASAAGRCV